MVIFPASASRSSVAVNGPGPPTSGFQSTFMPVSASNCFTMKFRTHGKEGPATVTLPSFFPAASMSLQASARLSVAASAVAPKRPSTVSVPR